MAFLLIILSWLVTCHAEFTDELQSYDPECLVEGAFFCLSGGCVSQEKYCDGRHDCGDGSDENFCHNVTPDALYCNETHQFMCSDGRKCVPSSWVCNNETDCNDGSDEFNCTVAVESDNSTCKGFTCDDGKRCISKFWMCDGYYDCKDKTDEDIMNTCRHALRSKYLESITHCEFRSMKYSCLDRSYCLSHEHMCDGVQDCRDNSDEGKFCENWHTMCKNFTCPANSFCKPERTGVTCVCNSYKQYNSSSRRCEDSDPCAEERPVCSHACRSMGDHYKCQCDPGYFADHLSYLCFAPDPEAMLFFSTKNDIRYVKVKSKETVIVATGIKQAHGVSYDGSHLYWVETARGHQAIMRAQLGNIAESKQVLAALGLEDPGDIAIDHLGENIYFSDAERGVISVCRSDGSLCVTLKADTKRPRFVTLDPRQGQMYWADWHNRAVLMSARMDGANSAILVDALSNFATGLALDAPNGRLYYVDRTVKVVRLLDKRVYSFFEEPFHHPYSLAVFESTLYWSDWTSNSIHTADKVHGTSVNRDVLLALDMPVFDMHLYHPVLMNRTRSPCDLVHCDLCLVTSNETSVCACPENMQMVGDHCHEIPGYRTQYLVVAGGSSFTRVHYSSVGNPETRGTALDVGRVRALAYDSTRDNLYIYDSQRKSISYIGMSDFSLGITHLLMHRGLENVVDMDYEYVTDNLYILDAGRRLVEAVSLSTHRSAIIYHFELEEIPISFCVLPEYGRMLVAVLESEEHNEIHIDSIRLDGGDRQHLRLNNIVGPNVRIRYSPEMNVVYLSDEGSGVIDMMHPEGTGKETFRKVVTTIASVAATDTHLFWTDRHSPRLYWADVHEATHKIRRIELSIFPNDTILHLLATSPPPAPGHRPAPLSCSPSPCAHLCVQTLLDNRTSHMCLCSPGYKLINGFCSEMIRCEENQLYCHRSNECFLAKKKCDGIRDCKYGEDEEGCTVHVTQSPMLCRSDQKNCAGICIPKGAICKGNSSSVACSEWEHTCTSSGTCVSRSLACDGRADCADGSDESAAACDTGACFRTEFMCGSGNCIPITWRCDGGEDCADGSDEVNCDKTYCPDHQFQCSDRTCIDLSKRCDGKNDCIDHDDEDDCDTSEFIEISENVVNCMPWEYVCEYNKSICLPVTARCNGKIDCPGSTDENGCDLHCRGHETSLFACKQEYTCIREVFVCNGRRDCSDGSDETAEACAKVNKTLSPTPSGCDGYRCAGGRCVAWARVCDRHPDCDDGSDENGLCGVACAPNACTHVCHASPRGPQCAGGSGSGSGSGGGGAEACSRGVCAHECRSVAGGFRCSCHRGYVLRADRRSCKSIGGPLAFLYAKGNSAWAMSKHVHSLRYHKKDGKELSDIDVDVRREKMYIVSNQTGKLIQVDLNDNKSIDEVITNVGIPSRVSVEWVTGNVYFWDELGAVRVCHFQRRRCAKLLRIPSDTEVSSLIVDPANYKMFYCISTASEALVRSASLSGRSVSNLGSSPSCSGLAADSFSKILYIASGPSSILQVDYDGNNMKTLFSNNPRIQMPHHLALFEDYVYFISGSYIARCLIFSTKTCANYSYLPNATNLVIHHESVQRDDVHNDCEKVACSNVCVLEATGPKCMCHDGAYASDGICPPVQTTELAVFGAGGAARGAGAGAGGARALPLVLVSLALLLFAGYVCVVLHRLRARKNAADYMQVRYNHTTEGPSERSNPIIDMPEAGYFLNGMGHEFVNPLQFVRNIWQESLYKKSKTIGTNGAVFETQQDLSDTESDLDVREDRRMIRN